MANTYVPIYSQPDPGNGIAGFDLGSPNDLGFAFDFNSSGNLDHIVFFRPGTGMIRIIKKNPEDDNFSAVFQSDEGISNWDLLSTADRGFAFDFDHNGKANHLVFYRPGARQISIFKNHNGNFIPVFESQNGIGAYDLAGPSDQVFAFDYNHRGNLDYLVLYRPGFGFINIVENNTGNFTPIIATDHGIGGYDIRSPVDRIYALDLESSGRQDYLAFYRPGQGTFGSKRTTGIITSMRFMYKAIPVSVRVPVLEASISSLPTIPRLHTITMGPATSIISYFIGVAVV